jgi:hypothetical protein
MMTMMMMVTIVTIIITTTTTIIRHTRVCSAAFRNIERWFLTYL